MTLKEEFKDALAKVEHETAGHASEIARHFKEIEKISLLYGVPVRIRATDWSLNFIPKTMSERFKDLDQEWITDQTNIYVEGDFEDYSGWMNSGC